MEKEGRFFAVIAVNEAVPLLKRSSISEYLVMESGVLPARDSAITINGVSRYRHTPLSFIRLSFTFRQFMPSRRVSSSSGWRLFSLAVGREHKRHAYVVGSELKLNPTNVTDGYIRSLVCGRMSFSLLRTRTRGLEGRVGWDSRCDVKGEIW